MLILNDRKSLGELAPSGESPVTSSAVSYTSVCLYEIGMCASASQGPFVCVFIYRDYL